MFDVEISNLESPIATTVLKVVYSFGSIMSEPVLDGYAIQETVVCGTSWSHVQPEQVKIWPTEGTAPFFIPEIVGELNEIGKVSNTFETGAALVEGDGEGLGSGVSCEDGLGALVLDGVCSLDTAGPGDGVGTITSLGDFEGAGVGAGVGAVGSSVAFAAGFDTSGEIICEELFDVAGPRLTTI